MNVTNKIIDLLKKEKLDILESIEILRDIESAFIEHLKDNFNEMDNKKNHSQHPKEFASQGEGETNTLKGEANSLEETPTEDEVSGETSRNPSADIYNLKKRKDKVIFLKDSDLIDIAKELRDSETNNKTKCKLSINGQCRGNFSPLKCDGLDIPKECLPMMKNKSEEKWE